MKNRPRPGGPLARMLRGAVRALERAHLPYALIGRLAVASWAAPVATKDLDVIVLSPGLETPFLSALAQEGFHLSHRGERSLFEVAVFTFPLRGREYVMDVFVGPHPYLAEIVSRARVIRQVGDLGEIRFASPEDMVVLKLLAARAEPRRETKDLMDALEIVRRNPGLEQEYLQRKIREYRLGPTWRRMRKFLGQEWFAR